MRSNLGAVLVRMGRFEDAISEYRAALAARPANHAIRTNLALAYYKALRLPEAVAELEQVRRADPANTETLLLLADCHLRLGENRRVIELLSPIEHQAQWNRAVAYVLGTALLRDNQIRRGQLLVNRILRDGDSAEARLMMATALTMSADFAGALKEVQRAVELNPNLPNVHSYYGLALMQTGDSPGAMEAFRRELASNPTDFDANLHLGSMLKQEMKLDEAQKHLEMALRVRPGSLPVRYQLGALHLAAGRLAEARKTLESVVAESPQFLEAHVSLATVYYRLGLRADGDREREIVRRITAERQAQQPGAKPEPQQ